MIDTVNPDLMAPGQNGKVLPTARFRNITDDGVVVESTKPFPVVKAQAVKYYYSTIPTASLHREDGKRLGFVHGILETELAYDQRYLDGEIADGNQYIRLATDEEVRSHKFRINPKEVMKQEVLSDPEVKRVLEDQIFAEMRRNAKPGSALAVELDAIKLAGVEGMGKQAESIKTATATIIPTTGAEKVSILGGIVTSKDIQEAAAGNGAAAGLVAR